MSVEPRVSLLDMVSCLSSALDLVSPAVVNHQKRTAFIATCLAEEMGLPMQEQVAIMTASLLHDCGALSLQSKLDALCFDADQEDMHTHCEAGAVFLGKMEQRFPGMAQLGLTDLVRFHHVNWDEGRGGEMAGRPVGPASHLIHLADRVEVLIQRGVEPLGQVPGIVRRVFQERDRLFLPEQVEAFASLAGREFFWLALIYPEFLEDTLVEKSAAGPLVQLDLPGIINLAQVFAEIVDFRSRFTATHSSGVAVVAKLLAEKAGFSGVESRLMSVAGYLHDLGKLAVPREILEKPGPLTTAEFNVMKAHPFHAYRLLTPMRQLEMVVPWVSHHHETLDGQGYPFHLAAKDVCLGARILAVSDIFTALTEDRPYRLGLPLDEAVSVLESMVKDGKLDGLAVSLLAGNRAEFNDMRQMVQAKASCGYADIQPFSE